MESYQTSFQETNLDKYIYSALPGYAYPLEIARFIMLQPHIATFL